MEAQQFGGPWTDRKLRALEKYLQAYLTIFTKHPGAKKFTRHYVDAFAGSGLRAVGGVEKLSFETGETIDVIEALSYMDGSVRKVLSMDRDFHKYWFVEKDAAHAQKLKKMIHNDFPMRSSQSTVISGDANDWLPGWCDELGIMDRAVVFLDPYGMEVKWTTIEKLAITQKVDLWMLFPSSGVTRMLPRKGPPNEAWRIRLTELFGDESWLSEFYSEETTRDLLDEYTTYSREVTTESVSSYLVRRLGRIFTRVVESPLILQNSRNSTLFMLVFAVGNPKGAGSAVSIANDIISST